MSKWLLCGDEGHTDLFGPFFFDDDIAWERDLPDCKNTHVIVDDPPVDVKMDLRPPALYIVRKGLGEGDADDQRSDFIIIALAFVSVMWPEKRELWKNDVVIRMEQCMNSYRTGCYAPLPVIGEHS